MAISVQTAAAEDPVSLDFVKLHLRLSGSAEDELLRSYIKAATIEAQNLRGRQFVQATFDQTFNGFAADGLELGRYPATSITSITYTDADGDPQTLDSGVYQLVADDYSARVVLAYDQSWPATRYVPEAVTVRFVAGYADADSVPDDVKALVLQLVGELYAIREPVSPENLKRTPGFDRLLGHDRVIKFHDTAGASP